MRGSLHPSIIVGTILLGKIWLVAQEAKVVEIGVRATNLLLVVGVRLFPILNLPPSLVTIDKVEDAPPNNVVLIEQLHQLQLQSNNQLHLISHYTYQIMIIETRATYHLTFELENLIIHFECLGVDEVDLTNGKSLPITHIAFNIIFHNSQNFLLDNMLCVLKSNTNLLLFAHQFTNSFLLISKLTINTTKSSASIEQ